VLGAAALWGTVGPAQVIAGSQADPGALGVARLLVGGAVLSLLCLRADLWRALLRREVAGWVVLAAVATGVYQVTFMHAVDEVGAALGTAIALGVAPIGTGVCARWWTGERLTAGWFCGTLAACAGTVVLLNPAGSSRLNVAGVVIALGSGLCYGVYTVAAKKFLRAGAAPLPATSASLLLAGLVLTPVLAARPAHLADRDSLALIGWTGIAATAGAYACFIVGLGRTSASAAGTLSLAEPLLAVALGVLLLRESLSPAAAAGCALLLTGLIVVTAVEALARRPRSSA
jgi:drug/metabolite transporter, DME family